MHRIAGGGVHRVAWMAHGVAGGMQGVDGKRLRLGLFVSSGPVTPRLGTYRLARRVFTSSVAHPLLLRRTSSLIW